MENIISAQKIFGFSFDDPSRGYPRLNTKLSTKIFGWIHSRRALLSTEQNGPSGLVKFPPEKIAFGPARLNSDNFLANDEATALWRQWHIASAAAGTEAENFRSQLIDFCMPMIEAAARRVPAGPVVWRLPIWSRKAFWVCTRHCMDSIPNIQARSEHTPVGELPEQCLMQFAAGGAGLRS